MAIKSVGMAFSREFVGTDPLGHIGVKKPVYLRFLALCQKQGWDTYVLTRKTYQGNGVFNGAWKFKDGKFIVVSKPVKIDLVYDRCAGVKFPPAGDGGLIWVNRLDFKILAWDKWAAYNEIGEYMPKTFLLENEGEIHKVLTQIKSDWVVIKPFNGLKGFGVFIGAKEAALKFKFDKKYRRYIAQEFVDTSGGLPGITSGLHDLRIAIVNAKPVWCHVRVPAAGTFLANAAQGGNLTEVDWEKVPESVKKIVHKVSKIFYKRYENPIYSLDFGMGKGGIPKIFEINDQIGFPRWEMKNREKYLKSLIKNFSDKLA